MINQRQMARHLLIARQSKNYQFDIHTDGDFEVYPEGPDDIFAQVRGDEIEYRIVTPPGLEETIIDMDKLKALESFMDLLTGED